MNDEKKEPLPLQSLIFGHRFKPSQTVYEYLLEFLTVARADKVLIDDDKYMYDKTENFPFMENDKKLMEFRANNNIALKRFIFFEKSKIEKRFDIDKEAYEKHIEILKEFIEISSMTDISISNKREVILIIQNLLYSFSAITQNRGWFAQSLLPICDSVLISELMGKDKKNYNHDEFAKFVDNHFETNRYNFMCRGGEVYYSHILNAINNNNKYKKSIESGFTKIITEFSEIEKLCAFIQKVWIDRMSFDYPLEGEDEKKEKGYKSKEVKKKLGYIPENFRERELKTLKELDNLLKADMHPFEKIDILANGMIMQIIALTNLQAIHESAHEYGYMFFDVECYNGKSNEEVKKFATNNYNQYVSRITGALANGLDKYKNNITRADKNGNTKSDDAILRNAFEDTVKVYKKLGKDIGIVRPINEKSIRFTLNGKVLKFLVLALIKPGTKMTFDRFLDKLFNHFNIIIGKDELLKVDKSINEANIGFLDINRRALQIMLKDCGFLRELSDSTSIVENPYMEVIYEEVY